jgi:hypothetical protein
MSWSFLVKLFPSIHLSRHPSMDGIIQGRKLWQKEITPLLRMCHCLGKACPALGGPPPRFWYINIVVNFLFEWHLGYICRLRSFTMVEWHLGYICRLRSFTMVSCMLLSHGSQAEQTSRFSMARVPMNTCGMWYIERFWKCSLSL